MSQFIQEQQTQLFNRLGVFFAFSQKQFDEQKVEGVEYVSALGMGDVVPKQNVAELRQELARIHREGRAKELAEKGIDKIIEEHLSNYECFYTGDISDAMESLEHYGVTEEQAWKVFFAVQDKYEC